MAEDVALEVFPATRIVELLGPNDCTVYKDGESRRHDTRYVTFFYKTTDRILDSDQLPHHNRSIVSPPASRPQSGDSDQQESALALLPTTSDSDVEITLEDMAPDSNDCNDHWIEPDHMCFDAGWLDDSFRSDWNDILNSKSPTAYPLDYKVSDLSMFAITLQSNWYFCLRTLWHTRWFPNVSEMY